MSQSNNPGLWLVLERKSMGVVVDNNNSRVLRVVWWGGEKASLKRCPLGWYIKTGVRGFWVVGRRNEAWRPKCRKHHAGGEWPEQSEKGGGNQSIRGFLKQGVTLWCAFPIPLPAWRRMRCLWQIWEEGRDEQSQKSPWARMVAWAGVLTLWQEWGMDFIDVVEITSAGIATNRLGLGCVREGRIGYEINVPFLILMINMMNVNSMIPKKQSLHIQEMTYI